VLRQRSGVDDRCSCRRTTCATSHDSIVDPAMVPVR
jgi:hypothetical protein